MSCAGVLDEWLRAGQAQPSAVVLSYATSLPPEWLLGLSAALFDAPLVLVGLGRPWHGLHDKYHGSLLASKLLSESAAANASVIFADAWDTMLVNSPSLLQALRAGGEAPHTLLSSECNSWPRCYAAEFGQDRMLSRCLANERRTCCAPLSAAQTHPAE